MAVSCLLLLNIHLNFFPCPGVNDKHNVGHFVLTIPCSFTVVYPRCKLCFLYLNIRLSCERYRKNIVKNTVLSGYQVNLPYREPFLLTLLRLNSCYPSYTKLYIYRVCCSSILIVTYPVPVSCIPSVCYIQSLSHIQCRSDLCGSLAATSILVYKYVVDKPRGCMVVMQMQRL